jgi:hypothetical protein
MAANQELLTEYVEAEIGKNHRPNFEEVLRVTLAPRDRYAISCLWVSS